MVVNFANRRTSNRSQVYIHGSAAGAFAADYVRGDRNRRLSGPSISDIVGVTPSVGFPPIVVTCSSDLQRDRPRRRLILGPPVELFLRSHVSDLWHTPLNFRCVFVL